LIKIFYKDASVAILVYDITRKKSFEEIKNYWVNQLKENAQKNLGK
jgi:GTPase SAR1 family protein